MNLIKKYLTLAAVLILPAVTLSLAYAAPANALFESSKEQACQGANLSDDGGASCDDSNGAEPLQERIQNIINILSVIIGIIAIILIIINGMRFITANGDSGSISNARNGVIFALVGLVIVALAQVIVRFVLSRVLG